MPEVGLEPTWALSPPDFESGAYTNFATPAWVLAGLGARRQGRIKIIDLAVRDGQLAHLKNLRRDRRLCPSSKWLPTVLRPLLRE